MRSQRALGAPWSKLVAGVACRHARSQVGLQLASAGPSHRGPARFPLIPVMFLWPWFLMSLPHLQNTYSAGDKFPPVGECVEMHKNTEPAVDVSIYCSLFLQMYPSLVYSQTWPWENYHGAPSQDSNPRKVQWLLLKAQKVQLSSGLLRNLSRCLPQVVIGF